MVAGVLSQVGVELVVEGLEAFTNALGLAQLSVDKLINATIDTAAGFEDQMAILEVVTRRSGEPIENLRDFAIQMGQETLFSSTEVAEAMVTLAKAGLDAEEIYNTLPAAIDLATASNLSLQQSAFALVQMMSTFSRGTEDATDIVNNLVKTADASVLEVDELVYAMVNAGPTAARFGMSMEDTNVALALFSERGIRGASAGTMLGRMLMNMNRDVAKVREAWDDAGVSMYDSEGNMRRVIDVFADLEQVLQVGDEFQALTDGMDAAAEEAEEYQAALGGAKNVTEQARNIWMQTVGGMYGVRGMSILLDEGAEGWKEMEDKIAGSADASTMAGARIGTFHGRVEKLNSGIESLMIEAGTPLLDKFLKPLATTITEEVLPALDDFIEAIVGGEGLKVALEDLLDVKFEGPIADALASIFEGLQAFFEHVAEADWEGVGMFFEKIISFIGSLLEMAGVTTVLEALGAALPGLGQVLEGIVDVIGALGRGDASKFLEAIREIIYGLQEAFGGFFTEIFATIDERLHAFLGDTDYVSYLRFDAEAAAAKGKEIAAQVSYGMRRAQEQGRRFDWVAALLPAAQEEFDKFGWDGANAVLQGFTDAGIGDEIVQQVKLALADIELPKEEIDRVREEIRTGLRYGEELTEERKVELSDLISIGTLAEEEANRIAGENYDAIYDAFVAVSENPTPENVAAAQSILQSIIDQAIAQNPELQGLTGAAADTMMGGIFDGLERAVVPFNWGDPVLSIFNAMKETMQAESPSQLFAQLGESAIDGIQQGINDRLAALEETVRGAARAMLDAINQELGIASPSRAMMHVGEQMAAGLRAGWMQTMLSPRVEKISMPAIAAAAGGASAPAGGGQGGNTLNFYGDVYDPDALVTDLRQKRVIYGY